MKTILLLTFMATSVFAATPELKPLTELEGTKFKLYLAQSEILQGQGRELQKKLDGLRDSQVVLYIQICKDRGIEAKEFSVLMETCKIDLDKGQVSKAEKKEVSK
jgi:hypothetical protein